ncbi:HAD-IIIA family hydrolase [Flavobacteriaceae bacterium Ap0902]|nr:HAD-IIIA family hydrolase [Flavobacteriaceae bacterium Ap0902]
MLPKLIITDIDGVWTDGSMYYTPEGDYIKKFHTYDSAGVLFARLNNIPVAIFTGETTPMVAKRAEKLKIEYVYQGVKDKIKLADRLCKELSINIEECAYIGDDINDIGLLQKVGFSACPQNAPSYIKSIVTKVLDTNGGEGAFRTFIEYILSENNILEETLNKIGDFEQ